MRAVATKSSGTSRERQETPMEGAQISTGTRRRKPADQIFDLASLAGLVYLLVQW